MKKILFDLDGTLIESRPRLYKLFQSMVPASKLSFEEYWMYKRDKFSHKEILQKKFAYSLTDISNFEKEWLKKIELLEWLNFDTPFEGVSDYLKKLTKANELFIVTARQFENLVIDQIDKFGWTNNICKVLVTGQAQEKYELIKREISVTAGDWLVGDTGKDIQTGKKLGMRTAGVLTGFLNKQRLLEYNPDIIAEHVVNLNFKLS